MPSKPGTSLAAPIEQAIVMRPPSVKPVAVKAKPCGCSGTAASPDAPVVTTSTVQSPSGAEVVQINVYMNDIPGSGPGVGPGAGPGGERPRDAIDSIQRVCPKWRDEPCHRNLGPAWLRRSIKPS